MNTEAAFDMPSLASFLAMAFAGSASLISRWITDKGSAKS